MPLSKMDARRDSILDEPSSFSFGQSKPRMEESGVWVFQPGRGPSVRLSAGCHVLVHQQG